MELYPWIIVLVPCLVSSTQLDSSRRLFKSLKQCLFDNNLNSASIVRRGASKAYKSLNYQFEIQVPRKFPLAYVLPLKESDVVAVVSCGRRLGVRIVQKSGTHPLEKYSYWNQDSIKVDLRKMKQLKCAGMTAAIGSGALIGPILWKLWNSRKVFIPAGSCPTVGISD